MRKLVVFLLLVLVLPAQAATTSHFVRLVRDRQGHLASLETSITRLVSPTGATVDLVAVTHLGEPQYYAHLNRILRHYDAVLYELVLSGPVPKGKRLVIDKGALGSNPLSLAQLMLAHLLGLDFQLKDINYSAPNFVHADLDLKQFERAMADRGETPTSIVMRLLLAGMARPPDDKTDRAMTRELSHLNLISVLAQGPSPSQQIILRRVFALSFSDMGQVLRQLQGTALLADRNHKALEVLRQQLHQGKRHLAIFFGAGHMPAMERVLVTRFGMHPRSRRWLVAWDLRTKQPAVGPAGKTGKDGGRWNTTSRSRHSSNSSSEHHV